MEIDLFTILILIFLLFPFLRRIFEGLKGGAERPEKARTDEDAWPQAEPDRSERSQTTARTTQTGSREERGEQSWEDFFEGLEKVVGGEEPDQQHSRSTGSGQHPERTAQASRQQAASPSTHSQSRSQRDSTYRHPSHGPVSGSGAGSRQGSGSPSSDPFSYEGKSRKEIGVHADRLNRELTEGDNPIYKDLDEVPEVVVTDTRGRKYIKGVLMNPEKLRDGILIKEILDPPKSRRANHHRL